MVLWISTITWFIFIPIWRMYLQVFMDILMFLIWFSLLKSICSGFISIKTNLWICYMVLFVCVFSCIYFHYYFSVYIFFFIIVFLSFSRKNKNTSYLGVSGRRVHVNIINSLWYLRMYLQVFVVDEQCTSSIKLWGFKIHFSPSFINFKKSTNSLSFYIK